MWICPCCNRKFKIQNQAHSCISIPIDNHFLGKNPEIKACYLKLKQTLVLFEKAIEISTKSAILYAASSNFIALKPKNNWLDIEFVLNKPNDEFPIYKVVQASKNAFAHFIRIENTKEIDNQLIEWIKKSYQENCLFFTE